MIAGELQAAALVDQPHALGLSFRVGLSDRGCHIPQAPDLIGAGQVNCGEASCQVPQVSMDIGDHGQTHIVNLSRPLASLLRASMGVHLKGFEKLGSGELLAFWLLAALVAGIVWAVSNPAKGIPIAAAIALALVVFQIISVKRARARFARGAAQVIVEPSTTVICDNYEELARAAAGEAAARGVWLERIQLAAPDRGALFECRDAAGATADGRRYLVRTYLRGWRAPRTSVFEL